MKKRKDSIVESNPEEEPKGKTVSPFQHVANGGSFQVTKDIHGTQD